MTNPQSLRRTALALLGVLAAASVLAGPPRAPDVQPAALASRQGPRADAPLAARLLFGGRLDVNRASAEDLEALPGLGPRRARRVVAERARLGRLAGPGDLAVIPGIGPLTARRLEGLITFGP